MGGRLSGNGLWALLLGIFVIAAPMTLLSAQEQPSPRVVFLVRDRHGHTTPERTGSARTGGGNVDVVQSREDTLIVSMTGVATAGPHPFKESASQMNFDLDQELAIVFVDPKLKKAKLTIQGRLLGLLRGDRHGGSAGVGHGEVALACGNSAFVAVHFEGHTVSGDENLAINDRKGPVSLPALPGEYHLLQRLQLHAAHARSICGKAASAEFAPDPALDPTWISVTEPFHGANKKELGFRVILRVEPE
jgi:hypothetical protein